MALVSSLAKGLRKTPRESLDPVGPPAPTGYAGTLPSTVAELNGWSLASPWTILYNFNSATVNPTVPPSVAPGSVAHGLIKWGSDATATKTTDGQSGYADQSGYTVNTNQDFVIQYASAAWKFSATVPTCYLMTFRIASAPASVQTILGGSDGAGGGWYLEAHETSGIRAMIGTGAVYVAMSHVGGTSFYDNEYHTVLLVIDDASGKSKLYTEFGNTESTSMTIASGDAICTIGPVGTPYHWSAPTTYLTVARGEHPLLYTNAQSLFDEYEDARLNNVNQTAIASLPKSLADLNDASGLTFTDGWNLESVSSQAALTGASTPAIVPFTGTPLAGGTGTAPTLSAAPQVRTAFTSQAAMLCDSAKDGMGVAGGLPSNNFTMFLVMYSPSSWTSGTGFIGRYSLTTGDRGFRVRTSGGTTILQTYSSYSTSVSATAAIDIKDGGVWRIVALRVAPQSAYSRIAVTTTASATIVAASSSTTIGAIGADPATENGQIGVGAYDADIGSKFAMCAWLNSQVSDANLETAINSFRWRYGI